MEQYRRNDLIFDVIDAGPADGPVVVLLHGFPQFNTSWNAVIDRLTAQGYRCLAPNQRGYSPGARPLRRRGYRMPEIVEDIRALIDASGAERVHLAAHDWGAAAAWAAAAELPDRIATLTPFSVPHPGAFLQGLVTRRQGLMSWSMYCFQLPWLPERLLLGSNRSAIRMSESLQSGGQSKEAADRDAQAVAAPGVLTASLHSPRATLCDTSPATTDSRFCEASLTGYPTSAPTRRPTCCWSGSQRTRSRTAFVDDSACSAGYAWRTPGCQHRPRGTGGATLGWPR